MLLQMEKTEHTAFSDGRLWTQAVALGCREQAGRWLPGSLVPNAPVSPQMLCSPNQHHPTAALNVFLLLGSRTPCCLPHPFSPPAWPPGFLRLVTQQGKFKPLRAATQRRFLEQPVGRHTGSSGPAGSLFSLLSPSAWRPGTCHSRPQGVPLVRI